MTRQRFTPIMACALVIFVHVNWLFCPAFSFSTFRLSGGRIHREITDAALKPFGFAAPALNQIASGSDSQDQPGSQNFMRPECHALNNKLHATNAYIKARLAESIERASACDSSGSACNKTLRALGQTFHAVQDFYAHSNYLEVLLSEKKRLEVVDWNKPPDKLKSCYYYYNGLFQQESLTTRPQAVEALLRQYPDLTFHTEHEFGYRTLMNCPESTVLRYALAPVDLSYLELNKDNPGTMEGSVVSAQYGQTYHELAKQLAIQDTLRTWQLFEKGVRKKYGSRADSILLSLKLGKPSSDY